MKKIKLFLVGIFILVCSVCLKATDVKFYDDYSIQIINDINQFRSLSFIEKVFKAGYGLEDLFSMKIPLKECYYCSDFFVDEGLMQYAKNRIVDIINKKDISHKFISDNNSQYLFSGEGIFILAFQNYVDIQQATKILENNLFKTTLLRNNPESVFMYYPYDRIGAAIATAEIEYEGVSYNIVILVVEAAITELGRNLENENKNNVFLGRIYFNGNVCGDCNLNIYNLNGDKVREIITNLDGSFFEVVLPEEFYLTYGNEKIKVNLKKINFNKNIYFQGIDTEK